MSPVIISPAWLEQFTSKISDGARSRLKFGTTGCQCKGPSARNYSLTPRYAWLAMGKRKKSRKRSRRPSEVDGATSRRRAPSKSTKRWVAGALTLLVGIGIAMYAFNQRRSVDGYTVDVIVPEFGESAQRGALSFDANCGRCHGTNAAGSGNGPPLVHRLYEPAHHNDAAIRRAVRLGVQPHHWRFGSMPRVEVRDRELNDIIAYVRELQRANGIR